MAKATEYPDPMAPVSLEPVIIHGVDTDRRSVVLDDPTMGKVPVGIVGKHYGLWSNSDAMKVVNEIMHRSPYDWESVHRIWDGKHFNSFWKTTEQMIDLPEVGDAIHLGLRLENSYDGSCKLRIAVMAYVLTCTNGMVSDQRWGLFSVRHSASREVDWDDAITQLRHGAGNLINHAGHFRAMTQSGLQLPALLNVASDSALNPTFLGKYVKQVAAHAGGNGTTRGLTLWDALNIGTLLLSNPGNLSGVRQLEAFTDCFLNLAEHVN
ncbi:MAG: DUF945 domain-containing protein [Candidatus Pacebacteria bacterium]|nr:DUF945 domain-containing protein [Candidatus Paceibacterota bacterium]